MAYEYLSTIKNIITVTLCPISVLTNLLLFFLIKYKSAKGMADYKKVLYLGCVTDLLNALWYFLAEPELVVLTSEGVLVIFTHGILGYLPFPWTVWTYNISLFFMYFGLVNVLVQFVFRYFLVCWNIHFNKWTYGILILCGAGIVLSYPGTLIAYLFGRKRDDQYYAFMLNGTEHEINGKLPPFGALPLYEFPNLFNIIIGIASFSYCVVILCGIAIWFRIRKDAKLASGTTRNYQRQISIVMTVEALIPVITLLFPISLNVVMYLVQISLAWEAQLTILLTSLSPVINPIVKLMVIVSYRKWIFQLFKLIKSHAKDGTGGTVQVISSTTR